MEEIANDNSLLVTEQIAIFTFELVQYENDVEFLLPDVYQKFKVIFVFKTIIRRVHLESESYIFLLEKKRRICTRNFDI